MGGAQSCFGLDLLKRAKHADENEHSLLPVRNLPTNNHETIAKALVDYDSDGLDVTKYCLVNTTGGRVAEVWSAYKEVVTTEGVDYKKFKSLVTAVDGLMDKLVNGDEQIQEATEFYENIKTKGETTEFLLFAVKPSR